jgi:hypothetical protein
LIFLPNIEGNFKLAIKLKGHSKSQQECPNPASKNLPKKNPQTATHRTVGKPLKKNEKADLFSYHKPDHPRHYSQGSHTG